MRSNKNFLKAAATKEMNKLKQEMVKIKNTFREYYQKQLDQVLKEKVEEFQKQIQNAEKIMHQELHKQEKLVNDKFQNEITRLQNAYVPYRRKKILFKRS